MKRHTWQRYKSAPASSSQTARRTASADPIATNGDAGLKGYPGAKNAPGVWQTIVNNIPPHDTFVECFAGSAAVTLHKRPATSTIVIESEAAACARLESMAAYRNETYDGTKTSVLCTCAVDWLTKNAGTLDRRTVIYCDPPYLDAVRAVPGRRYYRKEFGKGWQHEDLLEVLCALNSPVLLSGRPCDLYQHWLKTWRRVDYQTRNHGHTVTESLWCNFPEPTELHDYRFLGRDFRERERIKRKLARWRARLAAMPILERRLLSAAIAESGEHRGTSETAMRAEGF